MPLFQRREPKLEKTLKLLVDNRLEELYEQVEGTASSLLTLQKDMRALDTEMAALWEKVAHALSRIGGRERTKNAKGPCMGDVAQYDTVEKLNQAIRDGKVQL